MQTPISARHIMELEQREDPGDAKSVSPTMKTSSTQCMHSRSNRCRPTVAGRFSLPSSPSFLLLLATIIFAAFASSSSSFVHAAATTMASGGHMVVEETASAWSGGSSRSVQEDKLLDEDELTTSSLSRCVDHTVVLREENRALEAENSVLRDVFYRGTALDLTARFDKWEPKKWMSATTAQSVTAGISSATQSNMDLSTSTTLILPSVEERQLVSAGSDVVTSSSDGITQVGGRRLVDNCPTFLLNDHADLAASDGWNLLSVSCTLGTTIGVAWGKRMKIKKDPSAVGVVEVDRQATNDNRGRHFHVENGGALEVDGLTLTGGYEDVCFCFFI